MRVDVVFLIFVVFLIPQIDFAYAELEKPWESALWEKENPFIIKTPVGNEWNNEVLDVSIESLSLDYIDLSDIKDANVKSKVTDAKNAAAHLADASSTCSAVKKNLMANYYYATNSSEVWQCWFSKTNSRLSSIWWQGVVVLISVPLTPPLLSALDAIGCISDEEEYEKNLALIINCSNKYKKYWKLTMSKSADAMSESVYEAETSWNDARAAFQKLEYAGACDGEYAGSELEQCKKLRNIFESIDYNLTSGDGAAYVKMKSDVVLFNSKLIGTAPESAYGEAYTEFTISLIGGNVSQLTAAEFISDVSKYAPDTSDYSALLHLIWGEDGVIEKADSTAAEAEQLLQTAKNYYATQHSIAKDKLVQVQNEFKTLELEKIYLIIDAASLSEGVIVAGEGQTIANRFNEEKAEIEALDGNFSNAEYIYQSGGKGYLKNSTNEFNEIIENTERLEDAINRLNNDSEKVVGSKYKKTLDALADFESLTKENTMTEEVKQLYEDAKKDIASGKESTALGTSFVHYSDAGKKLAYAKNLFLNKPAESIVRMKAELDRLTKLISAAEDDNIEVSLEKNLLSLIYANPSSWLSSNTTANLAGMEETITDKAKARWGFVEDERARLVEEIALGGDSLSDLKTSMEFAEGGAFDSNGRIRWPDAIGKLHTIHKEYLNIESQITKRERALLTANGLLVSTSLFMSDVWIETPTEISFEIFIKNRYPYNASDVIIDVPANIQLLESDIVEGAGLLDGITQTNSVLTLYMKEVRGYGVYDILFKKNQTVAHLLSNKTTVTAAPDGTAVVNEMLSFSLDYDTNAFSLPEDMETGNKASVDGHSFTRSLKKGSHSLTTEYVIDNAYSIEYANFDSKKEFLKTTVQYDIRILPSVDIDELLFFVDKPAEAKSFTVTSLGWEKTAEKNDIGNGLYSFKILKLKKDKATALKVSYSLDNATAYIDKQLASFNVTSLSPNAENIYNEALSARNNNDTNGALAKIEELKKVVELEEMQKEKLSSTYDGLVSVISNEKNKLDNAISSLELSGINDTTVLLLTARSKALNNSLEAAAKKDVAEAVSDLKGIDLSWTKKELAQIKKNVFEQYNSAKKSMLNLGGSTTGTFVDFEHAYAAFEASNDLSDLSQLLIALQNVENAVLAEKAKDAAGREVLFTEFSSLKSNITKMLDGYKKEQNTAHGTKFAAFFTHDAKEIQKHLDDVENAIEKGRSTDEITRLISKSRQDATGLSKVLASLENEANQMVNAAEDAYARERVSEANKKSAEQLLSNAKSALANKKYVDALKNVEKVLALMGEVDSQGDSSLILLGLTALLIIGVVIIYALKHNKGGKDAGIGALLGNATEKPRYKKLTRVR